MTNNICDYSDYDYKTSFWNQSNRQYEHELELSVLNHIFKTHCSNYASILDAGCGFGRLFESYQPYFSHYILFDYAQNLIDEAESTLHHIKAIDYIQGSLYDINLPSSCDVILSIRTLHHLNDLNTLFDNFYKTLSPGGTLILDIPNKTHIKNRIKQWFRGQFYMNESSIQLSDHFYNYHPDHVIRLLIDFGFRIQYRYQVGLFRIPIIKKIIPTQILINVEKWFNKLLGYFNYAPSVYVVAIKDVDNFVDKLNTVPK